MIRQPSKMRIQSSASSSRVTVTAPCDPADARTPDPPASCRKEPRVQSRNVKDDTAVADRDQVITCITGAPAKCGQKLDGRGRSRSWKAAAGVMVRCARSETSSSLNLEFKTGSIVSVSSPAVAAASSPSARMTIVSSLAAA